LEWWKVVQDIQASEEMGEMKGWSGRRQCRRRGDIWTSEEVGNEATAG